MRARGLIVAVLVVLGVLGMGSVALAMPAEPAVDSEGASGVGPFGATLEAQVNPGEQETTCVRFEYGTSAAYGSSVPCANGSLGSGTEDTPASAAVTGLAPGTEYHFRVVVENPSSPLGGTVGADQTFTTPLVIAAGSETFTGVGPTYATANAQVDPGGVPTTYYVQYGASAAYGSRTAGLSTSAGGQVAVSVQLSGLTPEAEYHFRIVTESVGGVREVGPDMAFRALSVGIEGLPDGRVFEMVTPPENQDANVRPPLAFSANFYEDGSFGVPTESPSRAAADGNSVAYVGEPTSPGGNGVRENVSGGNNYFATRSLSGVWMRTNLEPSGYEFAPYEAFSSDLSIGILMTQSEARRGLPPLTAAAPEGNVPFTRSIGEGGFSQLFGKAESGPDPVPMPNRLRYAGASADSSRLLFEDLETSSTLSPEALSGGSNLYASVAGQVTAVNILPGATTSTPDAVFGGPRTGRPGKPDFSHVISADGSRIFWTDLNSGPDEDHVYVRENDTSTVAVSEGAAQFWTASADCRYVLYTEGERLLRFDVDSKTPGEAREVLAGSGAEVQGVLGTSEDGDYVYFAADGDLAPGAQPGQPNLYVLHNTGSGWESPRFIATLQPNDGTGLEMKREYVGLSGDWIADLGNRTAEVTPDGHGLVFMSRASLPAVGFPHGYDNQGLGEVYMYQAAGGGRLYCVSCSSSGEPPQSNAVITGGAGVGDEGVAAFLPVNFAGTYQPRWISEDGGRVFFDSTEPLVPADTNGQLDVYEWEPQGEGNCTQSDGCVYLLSGGHEKSASYFIDASSNGDNAFIATAERLVPQDKNENYDLYDARVGGVNLIPETAGCAGSGCQGAAAAQSGMVVPASATFTGSGNLTAPFGTSPVAVGPRAKPLTRAQKLARALRACHAKPKEARAACERQARKRYGPTGKAKVGAVRKARAGKHSNRGARS
jgi:hypothetical protein